MAKERSRDLIDHISFGVADFSRSTQFYDYALGTLGISRIIDLPSENSSGIKVSGYGDDRPWFWLAEENATSGMVHIAFRAKTRKEVNMFHEAAIRAGGIDNGPPGIRPVYHAEYYAAFVIDPDGHNIEAVCHYPEK